MGSFSGQQAANAKPTYTARNASVNSSCGAFAHPVSSGAGALANLARRAFAYPGATPGF